MFFANNNKLNITICGMMGSGKSTVGRLVAKEINYKFVDIDKLIEEKEGKKIVKIFEEKGENYFRNLEEKETLEILNQRKLVVSLGGGAIINKKIRNSINLNSYNIYLKVKVEVLYNRLKNSKNRPLIFKKDLNQVLIELSEKREKFYNTADLIIKNEENINSTIEKIIKQIRNE